MNIFLYNTITKQKEKFVPIDPAMVGMYVCGPTVYDTPHIGNARSVVIYDVLYRLLRNVYGVEHVRYVRNITDVDDKINDRARALGVTIYDLTKDTTQIFHDHMDYLKCLRPNIEPRATENIPQMIEIISRLLDSGNAYIANNHVYFDITSYKDYEKLTGRKIDEMIAGVRIEVENSKKNPGDFVLWKPSSKEDDASSVFHSPWGDGRPGWHIECSAMSHRFLGENFDIHGGGIDLIFPHHTNEIAQSCCAFKGSKFANYWVHNGFLTVNGEKMSKSLNNFITIKDLKSKAIQGEVIRYFLMTAHYTKPLDFNDKAIYDATESLDYLYRAISEYNNGSMSESLDIEFVKILSNDLNISEAFKYLHAKAKDLHKEADSIKKENIAATIKSCGNLIGILNHDNNDWFQSGINTEFVERMIADRQIAKDNKDWARADGIRSELLAMNVTIEDTKNGTIWKKA